MLLTLAVSGLNKVKKKIRALNGTQMQCVTCHLGSHAVTCHLLQVTPHRRHCNPSQTGQYSIYVPQKDGRLSWPRWLVTYRDCSPVSRQPITNQIRCRGLLLLLIMTGLWNRKRF